MAGLERESTVYDLKCQISQPILPLMCVLFVSRVQTNVFESAQKRKMSYFADYKRKAVVVIPPHHELRKRVAKRTDEMGSPIPQDAIDAMKGRCAQEGLEAPFFLNFNFGFNLGGMWSSVPLAALANPGEGVRGQRVLTILW